jgi:hypothetical protein
MRRLKAFDLAILVQHRQSVFRRRLFTKEASVKLERWSAVDHSSSNAFASFRSRVSNPSVNHP